MASKESARIKDFYKQRIETDAHLRYSLLRPGELYLAQIRERAALRLLGESRIDLASARILEVGCGRGKRLLDYVRWGAPPDHLFGIDLMECLVRTARSILPLTGLVVSSAGNLPFRDSYFDLVTQFYMFTSILDPELRKAAAREIWRVLRPGGALLWHDFRYPSPGNPNVRPVGRREIVNLFPEAVITIRSTTLAPPLARTLARYSMLACEAAALLPFLRTHYAALIRKPV